MLVGFTLEVHPDSIKVFNMTIEEINNHPLYPKSQRALQVTFVCLEKGIKDQETIKDYIRRAYAARTIEFPSRKPRGDKYVERTIKHTFDYLTRKGIFKLA